MERREHYDPEDIEQLLLERSFDELLEEERAYVLRHLSGRDEYEAMRRLLVEVQGSEPDHELLDADPGVRMNVMQVFRDRHKPQWRVWLNSVGASLLPGDASAMWRPALAFASLAAVIGLSVWYLTSNGTGAELAEVRPEPAPKNERSAPPPSTIAPEQVSSTVVAEVPAPTVAEPMEQPPAELHLATEQQVVEDATAAANMDQEVAAAPTAGATDDVAFDGLMREQNDAVKLGDTRVLDSAFQTRQFTTNSGYLDNWSMANAQGTVTREAAVAKKQETREKGKERAKDASRAFSQDTEVLALLRAAW